MRARALFMVGTALSGQTGPDIGVSSQSTWLRSQLGDQAKACQQC